MRGLKKPYALSKIVYTLLVIALTFILFVVIPTRIYEEFEHQSLQPSGLLIGPELNLYIDHKDIFSASEIARQHSTYSTQKFTGNTWLDIRLCPDPVWLSFPIAWSNKSSDQSIEMYVELGFSILNDVRFYLVDAEGAVRNEQKAGNALRESEKTIPISHPIFAFDLPANEEYQVVIRIESDSFLNSSITASTGKQAITRTYHLNFFLGIFYGCLGMIFFYNLFVLILTRRRSYLYYVLSVFFLFLYQGVVDGVIGQYFWFELNWGLYQGLAILVGLANLMALLFVRRILRLNYYAPKFNLWVGRFVVVLSLSFVIEPFISSAFSLFWMLVTAATFCLLVPVLGIVAWYKGSPLAKSYFIAWLSYPILVLVYVLCMAGILPTNYDTLNSLRVGTTIQAILMSFALAYYISQLRSKQVGLQRALYGELEQQIETLSETAALLSQGNYSTRSTMGPEARLGHLAEGINSLANALEQSQLQRQHWLADISHELRTPLTIFRGSLESMQDGIIPINSESLQPLINEAIRVSRLVDDLHDLSLLESHEMKFHRTNLHLEDLIEAVFVSYDELLKEKQIEASIEIKCSSSLVYADIDRLKQVFVNLMNNTVKYTDSPGKIVVVVARVGRYFLIKWEDSAPGVAPEELCHLFSRLYRAEPSRNRQSGGAGLGLALCHSIIENSGGSIKAHLSSLGGVEIEIHLPIAHQ